MQGSKSPLLPDHVLSAILTLAKRESGGGRFAFRSHDFQLQEIFRDLVGSGKYPILARTFVFSDAGPEPYSPILNESVSRLQLSGLIGRENPDYEVLFLRPAAEKFYEEALAGRLSDTDVAQLRGVATELLAKIQLAGGTLA